MSDQNDPPVGESFWQKDSLITHILFELWLITLLWIVLVFLTQTLGNHPSNKKKLIASYLSNFEKKHCLWFAGFAIIIFANLRCQLTKKGSVCCHFSNMNITMIINVNENKQWTWGQSLKYSTDTLSSYLQIWLSLAFLNKITSNLRKYIWRFVQFPSQTFL